MKFVYFGYDFMLDGALRLINDGHELIGIMSFECDNVFNFNQKTEKLAKDLNIPFTLARVEQGHIENFINSGAKVFLGAGYIYKIPPIDPARAYGINLHPSYLPLGRGIMPTPYIITQCPDAAGITIHQLVEKFDKGRILYQEKIAITEDDDVETYCARIAMRGPEILSTIFADLPEYWEKAELQNEEKALHFPPPTEDMRTINWNDPVEHIEKTARAFGRYGCLARITNNLYAIYNLKGWLQTHNHQPGQVVCTLSREIIVAASDGFICLKEIQPI